MLCPHFEDGPYCRCTAVRGLCIPSIYERERYCSRVEYAECPTYRACAERQEPLPQEVYYALWITPRPQRQEEEDCTAVP